MEDKITYFVYGLFSCNSNRWMNLNVCDTYEEAQEYVDRILHSYVNDFISIKITKAVTTFEDIGEWEK